MAESEAEKGAAIQPRTASITNETQHMAQTTQAEKDMQVVETMGAEFFYIGDDDASDASGADITRLDLATGKILDHIKYETGIMALTSGGTIQHREKHPGSCELVHVKDAVISGT